MTQRRARARAGPQIKNRHLAAFMYAQQLALLSEGMLLDGTTRSVREMLACVRDLTPLLEEILARGKPLKLGSSVRDLTLYRRRRQVLAALGVCRSDPQPPKRAA